MATVRFSEADRRERDGLVSSVLAQRGDALESELTVTWVEAAPGARQEDHSHPEEQVYVIVEGRGTMRIDGDRTPLSRGDLAHVPGGAVHGIDNVGAESLVYVSAATPAFRVTDLYDVGALSR